MDVPSERAQKAVAQSTKHERRQPPLGVSATLEVATGLGGVLKRLSDALARRSGSFDGVGR
jgi:hypothetical protein